MFENNSNKDLFAYQLHFLPFINTTDTTRLQMAAKYSGGQALPHINQTLPLIIPSGIFKILNLFNNGEFIKYAKYKGRVIYRDNELMIVEYDTDNPDEKYEVFEIPNYKVLNPNKYGTKLRFALNEGDTFRKGDILFEYAGFKNGIPTVAYPLRVMFGNFMNINHEDAIVISESAANKLRHYYYQVKLIPTTDKFILFENSHNKLLPEIVETYAPYEIIIHYSTDYKFIQNNINHNSLSTILDLFEYSYQKHTKSASKYISYPYEMEIINIDVFKIRKSLDTDYIEPITKKILEEYAKQTEEKYNKGIKKIEHIFGKNNPLTKEIINKYFKIKFKNTTKLTISDSPYLIKIEMVANQKFYPGDKISTIAGGKGVAAIVIPDNLMPKTKDNTPIDLIISTFTVPSRMNLNQIYDFYISKLIYIANKMLFNKYQFPKEILNKYDKEYLQYKLPILILLDIAKLFTNEYRNEQIEYLENLLNNTKSLIEEHISKNNPIRLIVDYFKEPDSYTINQILEIYKKYQEFGIKIEKEVIFENPKEICKFVTNNHKICDIVFKDDNPRIVKASVGILHIMNLYKVARYEYNARTIGLYKKITKQPTRGRKLQGGTRLGNDEMAMIISYDAKYLYKELAFIKSDDHINKSKFIKKYPIEGKFSIKKEVSNFNSYTLYLVENLLNVNNVSIVKKTNKQKEDA